MELRERLQTAVKEAMKAKQAERLSTLRMVSSAIKDREIAARGEGTEVGENDILTLMGKMVKQRQVVLNLNIEETMESSRAGAGRVAAGTKGGN